MLSMTEYAAQVAQVGVIIFDLIRSILNLFTANTVLFAFLGVALFGIAVVYGIALMKSVANTAITAIDGKILQAEEFKTYIKGVRADAKDVFDLNELEEPEILPDYEALRDEHEENKLSFRL